MTDSTETKPAITDTAKPPTKRKDAAILPRRTFTRSLRIKLTDAELLDRGAKLVEEVDKINGLEDQKSAVAKDLGGQIALAEGRRDILASIVRSKHEMQPHECYEEWSNGETLERRCDTGEIVGRKPCPQRPLLDDAPSGIDDTRIVDDNGDEKKQRGKGKGKAKR